MLREWDDYVESISEKEKAEAEGTADSETGEAEPQEEITLLRELISKERKQLLYTRILAFALCGLLAAVIIALCILVPPAVSMINNINVAVTGATATINKANNAIDNIDKMSTEITDATSKMNNLIETNSDSLTDAMKKLQNIDFEGLNNAISDLESIVQPLAKLAGKK